MTPQSSEREAEKIVQMLLSTTHHPSTLRVYFEKLITRKYQEGYTEGTRLCMNFKDGWNEAVEACSKVASEFIENHATHILHFHDKENRTTNERVFHEARFKEIAEKIKELRKT